jgi:hypothetical protein
VGFIALVGLTSACGIGFNPSESTGAAGFGEGGSFAADAGVSNDASTLTPSAVYADGGATDVVANGGISPLCGAVAVQAASDAGITCDPDDTMSCTPPKTATGDDAGAYEDAGTSFGCHVTATHVEAGAASAMTTCEAATADATEDASCYASGDCAPGFECVVGATRAEADGSSGTAAGVCRAYCCDNTCEHKDSFCDIETAVGGAVSVPVCVSGHAASAMGDAGAVCELLNDATSGPGSCGAGLTCQVVNQFTGQVACVVPGSATAGQSCESAKCAKGLSCILGYFPARECAQLCIIGNDDCPAGAACTASAAISSVDSQVGTCSSQ